MTTDYIMQHDGEPARIHAKTSLVLVRHHLDWAGLRRGESFVDFGCATGEVVREAAALSGTGRIVGLDGDEAMLARARAASPAANGRVEYLRTRIGGPGSTPLPDDAFDHAWARFFLEYQADPALIVAEMTRVVKPGARVTLIDLDGNCVWHYPLPSHLRIALDEVMRDLATTGFDPHAGSRLRAHATRAGLRDVEEAVEPYHRIVGRPDAATADQWRRKIEGLKHNYTRRLFPAKAHLAGFFDDMLEFVLDPLTMTWSNLHLVQGRKPGRD